MSIEPRPWFPSMTIVISVALTSLRWNFPLSDYHPWFFNQKHIFRYNIVDFLKLQIGRIAFG